ncbi:MAG TPA: hypothetical protein VGN86_05460 [Pyrinomonadaceae bacterium]|nr:hypothetical protein [Pyrinomonadaceae bacterium]
MIVEDERKRQAAIQIALKAGELQSCDLCEEVFETHSEDSLTEAYKIGNAMISDNDPLVKDFKKTPAGRKELSAILKDLWTDFSDECKCKRQARED